MFKIFIYKKWYLNTITSKLPCNYFKYQTFFLNNKKTKPIFKLHFISHREEMYFSRIYSILKIISRYIQFIFEDT